MTMTDPVADMLTRIRNANLEYKREVGMPSSKIKKEIARILKEEGFIEDYETVNMNGFQQLLVRLKFRADKVRSINGIKRISKPGLRVYAKKDRIPKVLGGLGIAIISTSKGLVTGSKAMKDNLGGEVICYVW